MVASRSGSTAPAAPEHQRARIASVLASYVAEWYEDIDGHSSGLSDDRPAWRQLLARLPSPDVAAVVVESWEKAARNVRLLLELVDECDRLGVRFISASDNIDTRTADGRFQLTVLGAVAEHYARRTGERRAASIDHLRRERGRHYGLAPFGTLRVQQDGERVLVPSDRQQPNGPDHAALVRAYEMYADSRASLRAVADRLNAEGWRYRDRRGALREWTYDDVRRVYASHWLYAGYITIGRAHREQIEILPGSHNAILPDALIAPVALRLEQSHKPGARKRRPYLYPLTGLLYCACGQRLVGGYNFGTRRYVHKLRCTRGNAWYVRSDVVEQMVRERIAGLRVPDEAQASTAADVLAHLAQAATGDAERDRVRVAVERLAELYADGAISRAQYDQMRAQYEAQMPRQVDAPGPVADLPPMADVVLAAPPELLRDMAHALYERVTLDAGALSYAPREWCAGWA